jgi:hypothetical protein
MTLPAAFQTAAPFGANIGGINPAFVAIKPEAEFDSWLSVGPADGSAGGKISSIGVDFAAWDEANGLAVDDGAVFWMDPDSGPSGHAVLAQLTIPDGAALSATMSAQGRSADGAADWQAEGVKFSAGGHRRV